MGRKTLLTEKQAMQRFRTCLKAAGGVRALSRTTGVDAGHISRVAAGLAPLGEGLVYALNLRVEVRYVEERHGKLPDYEATVPLGRPRGT